MPIPKLTEEETNYAYPFLELFVDPKKRVSYKEFRLRALKELDLVILYFDSCTSLLLKKRIDKIIETVYNDYVQFCSLFDAKIVKVSIVTDTKEHIKKLYSSDNIPTYLPEIFVHTEGAGRFQSRLYSLKYEKNLNYESLLNTPAFSSEDKLINSIFPGNTPLILSIANTLLENSLYLIHQGADINQYSFEYGNCPIILAISKGWNHVDPDKKKCGYTKGQREIIEKLLLFSHLDINAIHLKNGMTALHIACLRGDSIELIEKLLAKGATIDQVDYSGKLPICYLEKSYEEVKEIIGQLTDAFLYPFGDIRFNRNYDENVSLVATLPTKEERNRNISEIRKLLNSKKLSCKADESESLRLSKNQQAFFHTSYSENTSEERVKIKFSI